MSGYSAESGKLRYERYELKYILPEDFIGPLTEYILTYCIPDHYSSLSHDGYYEVTSLYFDTPNFLFIKNRIDDLEEKINMRIRFYGDAPELPYFMEVKKKTGGHVIKRRARVFHKNLDRVIYNSGYRYPGKPDSREHSNFYYFLRLVHSYGAVPKVLVNYRRLAFSSTINDYARITIDKDLMCKSAEGLALGFDGARAVRYAGRAFSGAGSPVIFELKCNINVPVWFLDLIRRFNLERVAFSKYAQAVGETENQFSAAERSFLNASNI